MTQGTGRVLAVGEEPEMLESDRARLSALRGETVPSTNKDRSKSKGSTKDRFAMLNTFVDFSMGELSRAEVVAWMILFRDSKGGVASTAQSDIARRGKIDQRTAGRAVRRLESLGLLKIVHRGGFRRGVSRYRVLPLANVGE